jgi:acyl-CoA dehydrogenase family protein 9
MREQSFTKSLFFGIIDESLLFPWPEPEFDDVSAVIAVLDKVRRFCELRVDPAEIDRQARIPEEVLKGLKELGCFGLNVPKAFGGVGLTSTGYSRVIQEVTGLDASIAATLAAHQSLGAKAILLFGTEEQKSWYLPRLASGEVTAAFALAEPGAGSDAGEIQTRAELQPNGSYLLNGGKTWITNGGMADLFVVFARTSLAEEGVKPKITAFLVDRGAGVRSGPNQLKLGVRGASTTELHFANVTVAADHVLGEAGRGFKVAMQVMDSGRLGLASGSLGLCKRILKSCVERCLERRAFGRTIGEFGLIKDKIATMMAETWTLESMTYMTTGKVDRGADDFSVESAICKVYGSEASMRIMGEALQIAAGAGYMADRPYERMLRDARFNLVFEGTNETLRAFIALSGMQGPGREIEDVARAMREPIKGFGLLSDFAIRRARVALGRARMTRHHPVLNREAVVFEEYVQELARGTDKVLYAVAACISRTTRAIERRGEEGARREIDLTSIFVAEAERRLAQTVTAVDKNDDELRKAVASKTYVDGGYPFDVL